MAAPWWPGRKIGMHGSSKPFPMSGGGRGLLLSLDASRCLCQHALPNGGIITYVVGRHANRGGTGYEASNLSRAYAPPLIERTWTGSGIEGANRAKHVVEIGG